MRVGGRRPWLVALAAAALLTLLLAVPASRVRPVVNLVDLLPEGSQAAADYHVFLMTFGGTERVFALVEGPPGVTADAMAEAQELVARRLAATGVLRQVRSGLDPADEAFFTRWVLPRRPLLEEPDLERLARITTPAAIRDRAVIVREHVLSPTSPLERPLLRTDPLGLATMDAVGGLGGSLPVDPASGRFQTSDPVIGLVLAQAATSELDAAAGRAVLATADGAAAELDRTRGPGWSVHAVGGPLYAAHDEAVVRADLSRTVTSSLAGCVLVLVAAFSGWWLPAVAGVTVGVGLVWTAGLIGLALGGVSAISLGFAAVLVGLGIDYAIHGGARWRDELLAGRRGPAAAGAALRDCGAGIAASAATTAAAFGVLAAAHFRPLRELGLVVAGGILAMLAATATVGFGLLAVGGGGRRREGVVWRALGAAVSTAVRLAVRWRTPVLVGAAVVTLLLAPGLLHLRIDADPRAVRPEDHPATAAETLLAERFGLGSDTVTVVVSGHDLDQALQRAEAVTERLAAAAPAGTSLLSPTRWLVDRATATRRATALATLPLAAAADRLRTELQRVGLDPRGFAPGLDALDALAAGRDPGPPPVAEWPPWLDDLLRPIGDRTWVAVRARLPAGAWPDGPPATVLRQLREIDSGVAVASALRLAADLRELAVGDLRRLGLLGFGAILAVVAVSFRLRLRPTLTAMTPVVLGTVWSLGLWGALGRPLDLVTLAVLPILLGIGIDDGLHAVHGEARTGGLAASVLASGRAMTLTTLTTCVGFGSLAVSHLPGLRHAAALVPLGVLACLAATLVVLPALRRPDGRPGR